MPPAWEAVGDPEPAVDALAMPADIRRHNIAAKGLGCCVFRSLDYASWWQNEPALHRFPEWMVSSGIAGGGWPEKVDSLIPKIAAARSMPAPRYVQYQGSSPAIIELALKTGRLPCITWQGNHMLSCVYLDAERAGILDNNAPDRISWYSRADFLRRWTAPGGKGGWVVVLLNPGPPPPPRGGAAKCCEAEGCKCYPCTCQGSRRCDPECECESAEKVGRPHLPRPHRPRPKPRPHAEGMPVDEPEGLPAGVIEWTAPARPAYSLCGRGCSELEAVRALVGDSLTDDSAAPHLTIIGDEAGRARISGDLAASPSLVAWKGKAQVHSYAPGSWELACGFTSRPGTGATVYLQDPTGRVRLRASYSTPEALAGALRRSDPSYDPNKDPDGSPPVKPAPAGPVGGGWITPEKGACGALGAGGIGAAAWLLLRRRHQGPIPIATATATATAPTSSLAEQLGQQVLDAAIKRTLADLLGPQPPKGV